MTYKTRFEDIREHYGLSREKFADSIGVDTQTVLEWENGIKKPDLMYLVFICEKYNISLNSLLRDIPMSERRPINLVKPDEDQSEYPSMDAHKVKDPDAYKKISVEVCSQDLPAKTCYHQVHNNSPQIKASPAQTPLQTKEQKKKESLKELCRILIAVFFIIVFLDICFYFMFVITIPGK